MPPKKQAEPSKKTEMKKKEKIVEVMYVRNAHYRVQTDHVPLDTRTSTGTGPTP